MKSTFYGMFHTHAILYYFVTADIKNQPISYIFHNICSDLRRTVDETNTDRTWDRSFIFLYASFAQSCLFGGKQRTSALVSDNSPYIVSVSARLQSASRNRKHTLPYLCILKNLPDIPFRFRLRKFCRYHRIFVRISDGCQDRCRCLLYTSPSPRD